MLIEDVITADKKPEVGSKPVWKKINKTVVKLGTIYRKRDMSEGRYKATRGLADKYRIQNTTKEKIKRLENTI